MTLDKFVYRVTCDKTPQDCRRHGNMDHFGGSIRAGDGKLLVPCPLTFGEKDCGWGYVPPPTCEPGCPDHDPPGVKEFISPKIEEAMEALDRQGFIGHKAFPEEAAKRAQAKEYDPTLIDRLVGRSKDCDVCYGTGRYKAYGGPCSEGCLTKGRN